MLRVDVLRARVIAGNLLRLVPHSSVQFTNLRLVQSDSLHRRFLLLTPEEDVRQGGDNRGKRGGLEKTAYSTLPLVFDHGRHLSRVS